MARVADRWFELGEAEKAYTEALTIRQTLTQIRAAALEAQAKAKPI